MARRLSLRCARLWSGRPDRPPADQMVDVIVEGGRIAEIRPASDGAGVGQAGSSDETRLEDCLLVPGLADFHAHVFPGGTPYGVDPAAVCRPSGVTLVVDGGSCGSADFPAFHEAVILRAPLPVLAFVNVARGGVMLAGELQDVQQLDPEGTLAVAERYRDAIVGIKVRLGRSIVGSNGRRALWVALEVAEAASLPLMVHVTDPAVPLGEILAHLRPGDIVTHCFHGHGPGILDEKGRVAPEARDARSRGVLFDAGHGSMNLDFETARDAIAEGFLPDIISTDVSLLSVDGPVYDMVTTMSKFLALGMGMDEVLRACSVTPRAVLAGALARAGGASEAVQAAVEPGRLANVTILREVVGPVFFTDSHHRRLRAAGRVVAVGSLLGEDLRLQQST